MLCFNNMLCKNNNYTYLNVYFFCCFFFNFELHINHKRFEKGEKR